MSDRRVTAVLGPTNTGKTHLALERMVGHRTGMIGFPLRLLARETYDRIAAAKGVSTVALITGEERITPPSARWFICTVEAMPVDRPVEFLAVDEVQLIADKDRGHVFTDRVLRARGLSETMLLGSEAAKPVLQALIPDLEVITRPRFSKLSYAGQKKLSRLPRRSAVVAFSAAEVYEIAELMRRSRGGCAVVMGALSPRARNAQVAMYQNGEVDFLVATDAIGMGLNMSLDHVAFAKLTKFDGHRPRRLTAAEIAQIAGRAGRYQNDGTFGTTPHAGDLDAEVIDQVENHSFPALTEIYWRSTDLDLRSVGGLLRSLDAAPPMRLMQRKRDAEDHQTLALLAQQEEVTARAQGRTSVSLLWEACQIPDFQKTLSDTHVGLVRQIFLHLTGPAAKLPRDWVDGALDRLDKTDGEIDTLSNRLAQVRTWTYISHRSGWLVGADIVAERARAIEDRLSDALHERLTQRFVDKRGAFLIRRLADQAELLAGVGKDGIVVVEGHSVGKLEGLSFRPDPVEDPEAARRLMAAARRALGPELARRVKRLLVAPEEAISVRPDGVLLWHDGEAAWPIAHLKAGASILTPAAEMIANDLIAPRDQARMARHLDGWLKRWVEAWLRRLFALSRAKLNGASRGLAHQLVEALGAIDVKAAGPSGTAITAEERAALTRLGVRFGVETIYLDQVLTARAIGIKALLASVSLGLPPTPPPAAPSVPVDPTLPDAWYRAVGYRRLGPVALRVDQVEKVAQALRAAAKPAGTAQPDGFATLAGCAEEDVPAVLAALGYRPKRGTPDFKRRAPKPRERPIDPDSPFAKLAILRR